MSMNPIIEALNNEQMKTDLPAFAPGDTVVIQVKVKEGTRERLQAYEGVVIAKSNRGLHSSCIVRKISHGVGVERTFQLALASHRFNSSEASWGCSQGQALSSP